MTLTEVLEMAKPIKADIAKLIEEIDALPQAQQRAARLEVGPIKQRKAPAKKATKAKQAVVVEEVE